MPSKEQSAKEFSAALLKMIQQYQQMSPEDRAMVDSSAGQVEAETGGITAAGVEGDVQRRQAATEARDKSAYANRLSKPMSPIEGIKQNMDVIAGTGKDFNTGRTMTTERALQDQTSKAALASQFSNPKDVGGQGIVGKGGYSDADFWAKPNAYQAGLSAQETNYDADLNSARRRFYLEHGQPGSEKYKTYQNTHTADSGAAPGTDGFLPAWLSEDRQANAPTSMRQNALDWRLNGGNTPKATAPGGWSDTSQVRDVNTFDPYSSP